MDITTHLIEIAEILRDIRRDQQETLKNQISLETVRKLISEHLIIDPSIRKHSLDYNVTYVANRRETKSYGKNESSIYKKENGERTETEKEIVNYEDIASEEDKEQFGEELMYESMDKKIPNGVIAYNVGGDRETISLDITKPLSSMTENIQPETKTRQLETTESDTSAQQEEQNIAPISDKEGDQCIRPDNSDSSESDPNTSDVQKAASALKEQQRLQHKAIVIGYNNMITEEQNRGNENRYIGKKISNEIHETMSLTQQSDIIAQCNASVQEIKNSNIILNCSGSLQTSQNIVDYSNHFSSVETRQYLYDTRKGRYIIQCSAQTIGIDVCVNSLYMVKILLPCFRYISDCHINDMSVFRLSLQNEYSLASKCFSVGKNIGDGTIKLTIHTNRHENSNLVILNSNKRAYFRTLFESYYCTRIAECLGFTHEVPNLDTLFVLFTTEDTKHNANMNTFKASFMVQTQKHFIGNQRRIVSAPIFLGKRENRSNENEIISSSDEFSDGQVYNNKTLLHNQPSIRRGIICIAVDSLLLYELCVSPYILLASCIHYLDTSKKENIFRTSSVRLNVVHFEYFESAMRESIRIQVQLTFTNIYTRDNRIPTAVPIYMYSFIYRKDQLR